jgi:hypothetical protein
VENVNSLEVWFKNILDDIEYDYVLKQYIITTLSSFKNENMLQSKSVVLEFIDANEKTKFATYQKIGDYTLWSLSFLKNDSYKDVNICFGRKSYYTCYSLLNKTFPVYEQLADELPQISYKIKNNINKYICEKNNESPVWIFR